MAKGKADAVSTVPRNDYSLVLYDLATSRRDAEARGNIKEINSIDSHVDVIKQEIRGYESERDVFSVAG